MYFIFCFLLFTYLQSYILYFYLYIVETDFLSLQNRLFFLLKPTYFHFLTDFYSIENRHCFIDIRMKQCRFSIE